MANVNPPPIRVPASVQKDPELFQFYQSLLFHLQQLWRRTGAGDDFIQQALTLSGGVVSPHVQGKQDHTPTLDSIGFLGTAADKGLYTTGIETYAEFDLTAFARTILDDPDEATFKATVNLEIGTDVQAYDATLQSISSLGTASDRIAYTTGVDTWAETPLTAFARTLIDDATAGDARTTLDVDQAGTDNSTDVTLSGTPDYITIAGQVITRNAIDLTTDVTGDLPVADGGTGSSTASGARTNLGVAIGSDVQAYSANLDEAGTFFGSTDISAAEAETLTDGSNADSLHVHTTSGLTDFTESTWTPAITFTTPGDLSVTYSAQVGHYVRIGNLVIATFFINTSAFTHTTASGSLRITGFPATASSTSSLVPLGSIEWQGITKSGYTDISPRMVGGTTQAQLRASASASAISAVAATDMPTGGTPIFNGAIAYFV